MKVKDIKKKVDAKVGKALTKINIKCKPSKPAKCVLFACVLASVVGCSTADAPTAQRAQSVTAKDITINVAITGCTNATPSVSFEIATAAQANDTSGTETMTNTPTQTPTNHIPTTTTVNYGLTSSSASGTDWITQLTAASAQGLASWLKSGSDSTMTVTKTDGTKETVACSNGVCTTAGGDCVTCSDGVCSP